MVSKRRAISIAEKVAILQELETGKKQAQVCRERKITSSTLSTILKNKEKFLNASKSFSLFKKLRRADNVELDETVAKWFLVNRAANVSISRSLLKEKVKEFAEDLGTAHFKCSSGWLSRFKQRHDITCGEISGEANSVSADDIFDAEKAKLFLKTPDEPLICKSEPCVDQISDNADESVDAYVAIPTESEVKESISVLRRFLQTHKETNEKLFNNFTLLENSIGIMLMSNHVKKEDNTTDFYN